MAAPNGIGRVDLTVPHVDKKFLLELKEAVPEYSDLELKDIAKVELRNRLFERVRELRLEQAQNRKNAIIRNWLSFKTSVDMAVLRVYSKIYPV